MLSVLGSIFFIKKLADSHKSCIFATTIKEDTFLFVGKDPVVQLVRMPPCHGGGRGFESRPDRKKDLQFYLPLCHF